ncbi:MAG: hemolysin family protein [Candidatus Omnitrophota bacterium]
MNLMFSLPGTLILLFLLALISFFFSASETAIIGLSKIRLRHMISKGIKQAEKIQKLITSSDKFIAAILIGNDFMNIAISAIVTAIAVQVFGYHWGVVIATFVSAFFVLIFCEITPKILAIKHSEKTALLTAPIMIVFIKIFNPVISIFTYTSNFILRLLRVKPNKRSPLITEEELRTMIEIGKEEGVLSDEERKMLHRIFEFGDTKVKEVMAPKENIAAVSNTVSSDQLLDIFVEEGYARLPVYQGDLNNIIGIVYANDLLYILKDKGLFLLHDLLHKPYFVRAGMRVNELLRIFQKDKIQMAIVLDEQKNTIGLVTLEDLMEEIVGEIEEEKIAHPHKKRAK